MADALLSEYRKLGRDRAERPVAYLRLRRAILRAVETGGYGPGQALPSERDLATRLELSRVTVRKALSGLVDDGVLTQRHGAGTFVAERIEKSFSRLTSFTEDLRARGLKPRSVFLSREVARVSPEEAMALDLSPNAEVIRLHRVRYGGDAPLAVEHTAVPANLLPGPKSVTSSLYEALAKQGHVPVRALQRLRAVALDAARAKQLHLEPGAPALLIERRAFLADGRAAEFTRSHYRGDAYDFVAELTSEGS